MRDGIAPGKSADYAISRAQLPNSIQQTLVWEVQHEMLSINYHPIARLLQDHPLSMNTFEPTTSFSGLYERIKGRWTGCDWPTQFGSAKLNLAGIAARQAVLLARATSGQESADWQEAAHWLTTVEADAESARQAAQNALQAASAGRLPEALAFAEQAVQLEELYHHDGCWQELRDTIRQQLSSAG